MESTGNTRALNVTEGVITGGCIGEADIVPSFRCIKGSTRLYNDLLQKVDAYFSSKNVHAYNIDLQVVKVPTAESVSKYKHIDPNNLPVNEFRVSLSAFLKPGEELPVGYNKAIMQFIYDSGDSTN
ncbi:MAG: hypothetical protein SP4CHLAM5_04020 [Chlamydiia bacterium]|nr:hypothetical protein [Chlamydiia bacterium]MCH9618275.1 hypothetical protein [Chlamydiia bacterium]MCH9624148.1 hypothetical protein [Chlamydiia bacterium]